ncbi:MAG: xanthine dehydrogenase family protein molybdopterin-binding subunit [Nitrososphaerota archaeon]|nr:xanthine dehydrogenase family protein molybdopterin-binding subunit [Nitrososphaerota archaeon]
MNIPGVKAIITCLDDKSIWHSGDRDHQRRVLPDRVRFVGETIAAVAATSRKIAETAVQALRVEYDELPAVFSIEEARKPNAPKIWDEGNVTSSITLNYGDVNSRIEHDADFVLEADYSTVRVSRAQIEPPVSLAWWEGDVLTVVVASQTVHLARASLSADLGIPQEKIRTITLYKGGGFGGGGSSNYDAIASILSKKAGKPVMLEYSREQDFLGTHGRWGTVQHLRAAVSKTEAKLLALDLKAYCDIGAYTRFRAGLNFVDGPHTYYSWDAWRSEVYGVYTNTPVTGYMRAPAGPASNFSVESFVDEIAHKLGMNPLELRLRNLVVTPLGEHLTSNGLEECLTSGSEEFGWRKSWRPPDAVRVNGSKKLKGVGMAVGSWHAVVGPGEAKVRIGRDNILEVYAGIVDIGTGAKTTMAMIAAGVMEMPVENTRVIYGDSSTSPFARGEVGSMTTAFTGTAVREASMKLRNKILSIASQKFGTPNLRIEDGMVISNESSKTATIADLITSAGLDGVEESASTEPKLPEHSERLSFTAHFAEVEVDSETGHVVVTRYVAAQDSGEVVNRLTAANQVQGSVVMGIGMALYENLLIDRDLGSVKNPSFMSYRLPNHVSIPKIRVLFPDVKDPFGPKSAGETSIVPVPAAIGNAIFNATGRRLRRLPFTPEDVLKALESATA